MLISVTCAVHGPVAKVHCFITMALFICYLHPIDSALDPQGPLSQAVPHVMINREVKKAEMQMKKRSLYLLFTAEKAPTW